MWQLSHPLSLSGVVVYSKCSLLSIS